MQPVITTFVDAHRRDIKFLQETSVTFIFLRCFTFRFSNFQSLNRRNEKIRTNELWSKTFLLSRFKCCYSSRIRYKKYYYRKLRIKRLRFFYCFSTTTDYFFIIYNILFEKNVYIVIKKNFLEKILLKI